MSPASQVKILIVSSYNWNLLSNKYASIFGQKMENRALCSMFLGLGKQWPDSSEDQNNICKRERDATLQHNFKEGNCEMRRGAVNPVKEKYRWWSPSHMQRQDRIKSLYIWSSSSYVKKGQHPRRIPSLAKTDWAICCMYGFQDRFDDIFGLIRYNIWVGLVVEID